MDAVPAGTARIVNDEHSDTVGRAQIRLELPRRVGFPPGSLSETGCHEGIVSSTGCDVIDLRSILLQCSIDKVVRSLH